MCYLWALLMVLLPALSAALLAGVQRLCNGVPPRADAAAVRHTWNSSGTKSVDDVDDDEIGGACPASEQDAPRQTLSGCTRHISIYA